MTTTADTSSKPFEPGTTGWTASDLDDPAIEREWFRGRYEIVEGVLTKMPPAYFTGGDEPYEKLKRALRAEIDEAAWSTLYSTFSRPIAPPDTGRIAVKVINHYGDEVLKVFEV